MKKYILTITARRKNAKRHVVKRSTDIDQLRELAKNNINDCYIKEIYTGNWNLIEEVK